MGEVWGLQGRGFSPTSSPGFAKRGGGTSGPKVTNATLCSDLKHRPSSRAKPRVSPEEERGPNSCLLLLQHEVPPLPPRPTRAAAGRRQPHRGKGCGFTTPHSGLSRGQAALPAQTPPRRDPREIANPDRGRPARGSRDCSVTAPGTEPEPPLQTPTPAGHRGQLPSAFWGGKNPTSQTFPTLCAAGIPQTHNITLGGGREKLKRKQEKGEKKGKPSSPCSSRGR